MKLHNDIARCCASKCPLAYKCMRVSSEPAETGQTWFVGELGENCEYFLESYEQNLDGVWMPK